VLVGGSSSSGSDVANPLPCRTRSKDTRARPRTCSGSLSAHPSRRGARLHRDEQDTCELTKLCHEMIVKKAEPSSESWRPHSAAPPNLYVHGRSLSSSLTAAPHSKRVRSSSPFDLVSRHRSARAETQSPRALRRDGLLADVVGWMTAGFCGCAGCPGCKRAA